MKVVEKFRELGGEPSLGTEKKTGEFAKKEVIRLYEKTESISQVARLSSCSRNTILRPFKRTLQGECLYT